MKAPLMEEMLHPVKWISSYVPLEAISFPSSGVSKNDLKRTCLHFGLLPVLRALVLVLWNY